MHPAAKLQFSRIVDEFARWRAIPEQERPPAPAWWWGPALDMHETAETLPSAWCRQLRLPDGASFAEGASVLQRTLAGQTVLPWPYDFSRKVASAGSDVRDLPVQPSDDSAFPP
ncbi:MULTISPECIES: hypothetical protein [unclassified Bradyrhizobium]|uniref:hypothetical protein n=1 Tax=unclassified Bradyrhizobium TaxID=2631580 RepID=UPI002479D8FF|nr:MULTISPECIES: hypothetical protein [unclassified Bradyrhizobium]WGS21854.1 hypothetical protein MTX22_09265 [Bradyrhizobium sp. ISRA463]WGS28808.1 hypothetical protein MTX19_07090 [Bradyrhizobium sp. ISRA464]